MAFLPDNVRSALGYWYNLVSDAARANFTVTDTIQLANQVAEDLGGKLSFQENTAISQLYGFARREINAGIALEAASAEQAIDRTMISTPAYSRDLQEQNTYPLYHVRFEYTYLDSAGNEQTTFKTSVFSDQLPATIAELQDDVQDDADGMAAKYGHQLLAARITNILSV